MKSRVLELSIEVEVFYETHESIEGDDADGRQGRRVVEWIPLSAAILTNGIPKGDCAEYFKAWAINQFNEKFNS